MPMADACHACKQNDKLKAQAGPGPWSKEPNRVQFTHAGLDCLLHRGGLAAWCGYVAVPPGHPAHGKGYDDIPVEVHGGLTYAEPCQGHVCHTPRPGEPEDVWWLGFDCQHFMDTAPGMLVAERHVGMAAPDGNHYWTMTEARGGTERVAEQVAAIIATEAR